MNISPIANSEINLSYYDAPNKTVSLLTSANEKSESGLKLSYGDNRGSKHRRIKRSAFDNLSPGSRLVLGGPLEFIPGVREYNPIGMIAKFFFKKT